MSDLKAILAKDRDVLTQCCHKEAALFKQEQEVEKQLSSVEKYDLRRYENVLYSILTEYCDYPLAAKQ
jgi:hypothetical protein